MGNKEEKEEKSINAEEFIKDLEEIRKEFSEDDPNRFKDDEEN